VIDDFSSVTAFVSSDFMIVDETAGLLKVLTVELVLKLFTA
jgi:hypothetical protein